MYLNPIETRLSDHFMLSDFMGCSSVYRRGLPNRFVQNRDKLQQGKQLAETLEQVMELLESPLSTVYGFISPELSRETVTYQDPSKPSYHRWEIGAATDFLAHNFIKPELNCFQGSPIAAAWAIDSDEEIEYSRMITYSESPIICFSTNRGEDPPRKAFYENRYMGETVRKPQFIRIPASPRSRADIFNTLTHHGLPHGWVGAGYPTYHLGGKRGYEHYRTSQYTLLSDFLYDNTKVFEGTPNRPPTRGPTFEAFKALGAIVDALINDVEGRVSIIRGYDKDRWQGGPRITVMLPKSRAQDAGDHARELEIATNCKAAPSKKYPGRIIIRINEE